MGGPLSDIPDMYRLISPIAYVDQDCPPTLLLHGTHDLLVDPLAYRGCIRRCDCNVPVVYLPMPGCDTV
ncbi:MAG: hypothetical protein IPH82_10595 [Chloroflexi bacterium]|nr:hypothetical protein [Chloroflexota bacterium]